MVPMGFTDDPKHGMVKLFCPKCRDVYNCHPTQRHIDGAFFGPTFPNLFFMTYENLVPGPAMEQFVPRVFGFRIHPCSNSISNRTPMADMGIAGRHALTRGVAVPGVGLPASSGGGALLIGHSAGASNGLRSTVAAESSSSNTLVIQSRGGSTSGMSHVIRGETETADVSKNNSGESNHNSISEETLAIADLKGLAKSKNRQSVEVKEDERGSGIKNGAPVAEVDNTPTDALRLNKKAATRQSKRVSEEASKDAGSVSAGRVERVTKRGRR